MERKSGLSDVQVLVTHLDHGPGAAAADERSLVEVVGGALADRSDASVTPAVAKVGVEAIILALGSAGAITAAVEALRLWLARDRGRRVQLSWSVGGQQGEVVLSADKLSEAGARELLLAVLGDEPDSDEGQGSLKPDGSGDG
jgi:hypothetical protein